MKKFIIIFVLLFSTVIANAQSWVSAGQYSNYRSWELVQRRAETITFYDNANEGAVFSSDIYTKGSNKSEMEVWWQYEPAINVVDFRISRNNSEICRYSIKNGRVYMNEFKDGITQYVIEHEGDVVLVVTDASFVTADIRINQAKLDIHNRL